MVCIHLLVKEEALKINQIVYFKLVGDEIYDNSELLLQSGRRNYRTTKLKLIKGDTDGR